MLRRVKQLSELAGFLAPQSCLGHENQEYDILYFRSLENIRSSKDFVCKDIISKGKTVYERR